MNINAEELTVIKSINPEPGKKGYSLEDMARAYRAGKAVQEGGTIRGQLEVLNSTAHDQSSLLNNMLGELSRH